MFRWIAKLFFGQRTSIVSCWWWRGRFIILSLFVLRRNKIPTQTSKLVHFIKSHWLIGCLCHLVHNGSEQNKGSLGSEQNKGVPMEGSKQCNTLNMYPNFDEH